MKTCPVGCGRKPRSGCYLCTECWYALPRAQRAEFNRAWRDYRRACDMNIPATAQRRVDAVKEYRRVREYATAVARDALKQPDARQ